MAAWTMMSLSRCCYCNTYAMGFYLQNLNKTGIDCRLTNTTVGSNTSMEKYECAIIGSICKKNISNFIFMIDTMNDHILLQISNNKNSKNILWQEVHLLLS